MGAFTIAKKALLKMNNLKNVINFMIEKVCKKQNSKVNLFSQLQISH
jgi:hypothetical protein